MWFVLGQMEVSWWCRPMMQAPLSHRCYVKRAATLRGSEQSTGSPTTPLSQLAWGADCMCGTAGNQGQKHNPTNFTTTPLPKLVEFNAWMSSGLDLIFVPQGLRMVLFRFGISGT
mmetsp:Transcript_14243/g.19640  ORF Transcript_14243/g.19640 Transcript_14243/m.19640 type:complete len:115 (-) Transcript_14243:423-767(-)